MTENDVVREEDEIPADVTHPDKETTKMKKYELEGGSVDEDEDKKEEE